MPLTPAENPNSERAPICDDQPPLDRMYTNAAVVERTSLSRVQIWRDVKAGTFPAPVQISEGRVAWRESDLRAWFAGRTTSTIALARARKKAGA